MKLTNGCGILKYAIEQDISKTNLFARYVKDFPYSWSTIYRSDSLEQVKARLLHLQESLDTNRTPLRIIEKTIIE